MLIIFAKTPNSYKLKLCFRLPSPSYTVEVQQSKEEEEENGFFLQLSDIVWLFVFVKKKNTLTANKK